MINGFFSSEIYQILEKSLNAAAQQHKLISNNIANVETPGFKTSEVVFQSKLREILDSKEKDYLPLKVTHPNHIPIIPDLKIEDIEPEIITRTETTSRNDGNNVDIDLEMSKLAENTTYYSTIAQLMTLKLSTLKDVITEGRR
jgi:flagellar basal-body rod protein FlgB